MPAKRALVVDDSRSARAFLTRLLDKYGLEVHPAESAEAAIQYLTTGQPDVIFMDHLMPGMDGFQAVQAIKANPMTASIPIVMYTSQEGELYLGQARALGAFGVLPKQIKPADIAAVLQQLNLIEERRFPLDVGLQDSRADQERLAAAAVLQRLEEMTATTRAAQAAGVAPPPLSASPAPAASGLNAPRQAAALSLDSAELRRQLEVAFEQQSERLRREWRQGLDELPQPAPAETSSWTSGLFPALMTVAALGLGALWLQAEVDRRALRVQLAQVAGDRVLSSSSEPAALASAAPAEAAPASMPRGPVMLPVAYGEQALVGERVTRLQSVLVQLAAAGFQGSVDILVYPATFCLVGNSSEGYSLASDAVAVSACTLMGNPAADAAGGDGLRESPQFSAFLQEFRRQHAGIELRLVAGTLEQALRAYPQTNGATVPSAGDWNAAAKANSRVEVRWRARS
ncbi:MAG: response regulator [Proteobacteria bacterium]|nr:response regulator [Pseudomonadota bacterium]